MSFMPVRHISPSGRSNWSAMLRTAAGPSFIIGMPPARAKRPVTGTLPFRNTAAVDRRAPAPLLSNVPARQTRVWSSYVAPAVDGGVDGG